MNRRHLGLAVLAVAALGIAGCGGTVPQNPDLAGTNPKAVSGTITFWDTADATNEAPAFRELVARFEKKYPKIEVNYANIPFDNADNKFRIAAQAGDGAPDVMRADVGWTPTFAALGYLQPLDGTPALHGDEDYLPGPNGSTKLGGKTYGVPQVTDTLALLYNKKLFARAGITEPPRTWRELRETARRIERALPGVTGFFAHSDAYYLLPFAYGQGGDYVDVRAKKVTIDSDRIADAVRTVRELITPGTGRTDTSANGYTNMQNDFKSGKIAMVLNGPWSTSDTFAGSAFRDRDNLGVAEMPAGPHGRGGPIGGHNLVVYAGSANLAASYLFVEFLNSAESQRYVAERNNTMPTRKSVYDQGKVATNPVIQAFQRPLLSAVPRPGVPGAGDLYDLFTPYYQRILSGGMSIADGLAQAHRKALDYVPHFSG